MLWYPRNREREYEHRAKAERALGRPLPLEAEVHHVDGSMSLASPLVICQDRAYHKLLHARTRVVKAGGDPDKQRICGTCKALKDKDAFYEGDHGHPCKPCWRKRLAAQKARRLIRLGIDSVGPRLKTHCPSGHEYSAENTRTVTDGGHTYRACKTCMRETHKRFRLKRRKIHKEQAA